MSTGESSIRRNDSVGEGTRGGAERATFTGNDVMSLHQDRANVLGGGAGTDANRSLAGNDANLPNHFTFDNSIYNSVFDNNSNKAGDAGKYKVASLSDTPPPSDKATTGGDVPKALRPDETQAPTDTGAVQKTSADSRQFDRQFQSAEKFAFGGSMTGTEAQEGKDNLKAITDKVYRERGEKGLKDLAADMSDAAKDFYGDDAFGGKKPAIVSATKNADGSTQVQYNFRQPGSGDSNPVVLQLDKPPVARPQRPYFDDNPDKPHYTL